MDEVRPDRAGSSHEMWECALHAQSAGDYVDAISLFSAYRPDPAHDLAEIEFHIAWCLEKAGQYARATVHYEQAVAHARQPTHAVEALYRLAWMALEEHAIHRARPLLAHVLSLAEANGLANPVVEHARYWFAVCVETDGEIIEACARYAVIANNADPDLWHEAAYRRLLCLSQIGDFAAALAAADTLVRATAAVRDPTRLRDLQAAAHEERAQIARARAAA
jgi:tetratricopeptide (TPR) repeat protein